KGNGKDGGEDCHRGDRERREERDRDADQDDETHEREEPADDQGAAVGEGEPLLHAPPTASPRISVMACIATPDEIERVMRSTTSSARVACGPADARRVASRLNFQYGINHNRMRIKIASPRDDHVARSGRKPFCGDPLIPAPSAAISSERTRARTESSRF